MNFWTFKNFDRRRQSIHKRRAEFEKNVEVAYMMREEERKLEF
jgi:hypothetical protein